MPLGNDTKRVPPTLLIFNEVNIIVGAPSTIDKPFLSSTLMTMKVLVGSRSISILEGAGGVTPFWLVAVVD
jgi:hypothetical protein